MREPKAGEDEVVLPGGSPGEQVGAGVGYVGGGDFGSVDGEGFGRGIDGFD